MRKKIAIVASASFLLSCGGSQREQIQGDWYSFDSDSVYFELYVNDTIIVLNQPEIGPVGYDYQVKDDKLIVSNSVGMERIWTIEEVSSNSMFLRDSLERIGYTRLSIEKGFFESLGDSTSFRVFSDNFNTRISSQNKK